MNAVELNDDILRLNDANSAQTQIVEIVGTPKVNFMNVAFVSLMR